MRPERLGIHGRARHPSSSNYKPAFVAGHETVAAVRGHINRAKKFPQAWSRSKRVSTTYLFSQAPSFSFQNRSIVSFKGCTLEKEKKNVSCLFSKLGINYALLLQGFTFWGFKMYCFLWEGVQLVLLKNWFASPRMFSVHHKSRNMFVNLGFFFLGLLGHFPFVTVTHHGVRSMGRR